jgi:hypothetical protein
LHELFLPGLPRGTHASQRRATFAFFSRAAPILEAISALVESFCSRNARPAALILILKRGFRLRMRAARCGDGKFETRVDSSAPAARTVVLSAGAQRSNFVSLATDYRGGQPKTLSRRLLL